jgi:hypothetical protein
MGAVIDELRTTPAVRPSPLETLQDGVILYELVGGELVEKKLRYLASLVASRFFGLLFSTCTAIRLGMPSARVSSFWTARRA